jgi:hypothetical protein
MEATEMEPWARDECGQALSVQNRSNLGSTRGSKLFDDVGIVNPSGFIPLIPW